MNTTGNDLAKQGQNFADKAADKVQTGIQSARQTGAEVSDKLSGAVETARTQAGPSAEAGDAVRRSDGAQFHRHHSRIWGRRVVRGARHLSHRYLGI